MNKASFFLILAMCSAAVVYGQDKKFTVDAFAGYSLLNSASEIKISENGEKWVETERIYLVPLGLRFEFQPTTKLGYGLLITHTNMSLTMRKSGTPDYLTIRYPRTRIVIFAAFHVLKNPDNWRHDLYFITGGGVSLSKLEFETNDSLVDENSLGIPLIPVAIRLGMGYRFYITENIGLRLEFGLGGPVLDGGISFRF
ncbi:MAG: hypothetical protein KDC37_06445 [Flavobacteriales bacterium]|nr:hypothetical protein [Flavobacteriales bacterium]